MPKVRIKNLGKIALHLGEILKEKRMTISFAESMTGGKISSLISSNPGSSVYFTGGIIAYDNRIKTQFLQVDKEVIKKQGAVSEGCAIAMAQNVKVLFATEVSLAVTGIAGPTGATLTKPVGLVYVAFSTPNKTWSTKFNFKASRERVIELTAMHSMLHLSQHLVNEKFLV